MENSGRVMVVFTISVLGVVIADAIGGGIYFVGFIGAAAYYLYTSTGFWMGVWGILKALVWPAILVFELLKFLSL